MDQPAWLAAAWAEFGVREKPGKENSEAVLNYFREAGFPDVGTDNVAWCAAFVGAILKRCDVAPSGSLLAQSYLSWGTTTKPQLGAIVVLSRGNDPDAGHVGFLVGTATGKLFLLGGNQSDAVSIDAFDSDRLLDCRWPKNSDAKSEKQAAWDIFALALAHVLEMEGGYSDDPYDSGGPTNRGITLEDLARWKSVTVDASNRTGLIEELRRISDGTVEAIYRNRYWLPAVCPDLPPSVAVMHFDAAVNHGLGAAKRMLQAAAGIGVDGEIGPVTLDAVARASASDLVARYADLRRSRYRALPTFWRFGNGWLKRVDATQRRAESLLTISERPLAEKGQSTMNDLPPSASSKPWTQSKTIWGALITAAATVIPVLAPAIGLDLPGDTIRQAGDQTLVVVQAITGLFGTLLTIYGRIKARQTIDLSK